MLEWLLGTSNGGSSARKYNIQMTIHLNCDRSSRVHDLEGDIERREGESLESMYARAIEEYLTSERIRGAHPVQILKQRCW